VTVRLDDALIQELKENFNLVGYFPPPTFRGIKRLLRLMTPRGIQLLRRYQPDRRLSDWLTGQFASTPYQLIVGRYLEPAARANLFAWHPLVLDIDDLDHVRHSSRAESGRINVLGRLRIRLEASFLARLVGKYLDRCDHVWITRTEDSSEILHDRLSLLPNVPFDGHQAERSYSPPSPQSMEILFVGHLRYDVNVRAIDHFLLAVWPRILAERNSARFRIVGSGGEAFRLKAWSERRGVEVAGYVEDLGSAYASCSFALCPINEGAGTKIKVLEALYHHRSCVMTQHSHRGFEDTLVDGESVLVAKNDEELVRLCVGLLGDHDQNQRLASAGAAAVRQHFSESIFRQRVRQTVEQLADSIDGVKARPL
jgi:glycosyltransferase involved in cell wall biosynthesis